MKNNTLLLLFIVFLFPLPAEAADTIFCIDRMPTDTIVLRNGKYIGEWRNCKMHGKGTFYLKNETVMKGHWVDNEPMGNFTILSKYGGRLEGRIDGKLKKRKVMDGATVYRSDGSKAGKFKAGKVFCYKFKSPYKPDSIYIFESVEGLYSGQLNSAGQFHGKGKLLMSTGNEYEGEFEYGKICGQGISYFFYENIRYEGEFQDGSMSGFGKFYHGDTLYYEGEYRDGKLNGKGISYVSNGDRYEGRFVNGKKHGVGTYHFADGRIYDGELTEDKLHGYGAFYYKGGGKYIGSWKDKLRCGEGASYGRDGKMTYEGEWRDDRPNGQGTRYYEDGTKYVGEVKNWRKDGSGTLYDKDGNIVRQGLWSNDKPN